MAENVLTIDIRDSGDGGGPLPANDTLPPAPVPAGGPSDLPAWYPQFRELQNRADSGGPPLSPDEQDRLAELRTMLQVMAAQQTPIPEPPAPTPTPAEAPDQTAPADTPQETPIDLEFGRPTLSEADRLIAEAISPTIERLRKNLLTADEAFDRLNRQLGKSDSFTDALRDKGETRTSIDYLRDTVAKTAEASGQSGLSPGDPLKDLLEGLLPGGKQVTTSLDALGVKLPNLTGMADGLAGSAGLGTAANAVPQVAAILGVAELASGRLATSFDRIREATESAGAAARGLAGNDGLAVLESATGLAASTMSQIPIVGKVYAAEIEAATAVVREFQATAQAFIDRGRELSGYDARLAAENSLADVRRLQGDINEAQRMSESLSKLTEEQSKLEQDVRELLLPIKDVLATILAEVVSKAGDVVGVLKTYEPAIRAVAEIAKFMIKAESYGVFTAFQLINEVLEAVKKVDLIGRFIAKPPNEVEVNQIMKEIFDLGDMKMGPFKGGADPAQRSGEAKLNFPLLG